MNKQIKQIRTPKIKKPTIRYDRFCKKLLEEHYNNHIDTCIFCGDKIWNYNGQRKTCYSCLELKNRISKRVTGERRFQRYGKQIDILTSLEYSDESFTTELCNMDCENCIYEDCILPIEN